MTAEHADEAVEAPAVFVAVELAPVDLELIARLGLVAHRERLHAPLLFAERPHEVFHERDLAAVAAGADLAQQYGGTDLGLLLQSLAQVVLVGVQDARPLRARRVGRRAVRPKVTAHRVSADAEFAGDPTNRSPLAMHGLDVHPGLQRDHPGLRGLRGNKGSVGMKVHVWRGRGLCRFAAPARLPRSPGWVSFQTSPKGQYSTGDDIEDTVVSTASGLIGGATDLSIGANGRLYLADSRLTRVLSVRPDSTDPHVIGREGSGPGEFSAPGGLATSADSLWVFDARRSTVQAFTLDGEYVRTYAVEAGPFGRGRALNRYGALALATGGLDSVLIAVVNASGDRARSFGRPVAPAVGIVGFHKHQGPDSARACPR